MHHGPSKSLVLPEPPFSPSSPKGCLYFPLPINVPCETCCTAWFVWDSPLSSNSYHTQYAVFEACHFKTSFLSLQRLKKNVNNKPKEEHDNAHCLPTNSIYYKCVLINTMWNQNRNKPRMQNWDPKRNCTPMTSSYPPDWGSHEEQCRSHELLVVHVKKH